VFQIPVTSNVEWVGTHLGRVPPILLRELDDALRLHLGL